MISLRSSGLVLFGQTVKTDQMVDAQADLQYTVTDAQADTVLRLAHTSFCLFCHDLLHLCKA